MVLAEHTTTTAREAFEGVEVAVLPTGSTEQHGPALPLGTDYMVAEALARSVSNREDVTVLPTVPVGVSEHHRQFDGTLWTSPETFEAYVRDIVKSMASHGVRKAVIVNGHGGNTDALSRACRSVRRNEVAFAVQWNWWNSVDEVVEEHFDGFPGHAGEVETSMVLRVVEELVRKDALEEAEKDASESWGKEVHGANVGFDTIDFTPTGAVGHPTKGSRKAGEDLFEKANEELNALIDWLGDQGFKDLMPREHK